MSRIGFPSRRSTPLLNVVSGSDATFTFATAWMESGIPPFENAFCTVSSMGIVASGIHDTCSRIGMRMVRPPITAR